MAIIGTTTVLPRDQKRELLQLTEVPNKLDFLEAAPNMASKVATLKKFYADIQPLEGNNFIVTDEDGNRFQLDNKNKTNLADAIDLGKATELVGSMIGHQMSGYIKLYLLLVQMNAIVGSGVNDSNCRNI